MSHAWVCRWCSVPIMLGIVAASWGQDPPAAPRQHASNLAKLFEPARPVPLDPAALAGLAPGTRAEPLTWERVERLALVRARAANPPRFAELDPARLAAAADQVGAADFARFRPDFDAGTKFRDPALDFMNLQIRLAEVQNAASLIRWHESWNAVLSDLVNGESAGLGLKDLDQSLAATDRARRSSIHAEAQYRDSLDACKLTLGLGAEAAVTVDPAGLAAFQAISGQIARWSLSQERNLNELDQIVARYPALGDLTVEGHALLAELAADPKQLAALQALVVRVARAHHRDCGEDPDAVAVRVRRELRHLAEIQADYGLELKQAVMAVRSLDDAFEQIISPPTDPAARRANLGILGLTSYASQVYSTRNRLVTLWGTFRVERLALNRDLGLFPFDDWASFLGQFVAEARPPASNQPNQPGRPIEPARVEVDPPLPPAPGQIPAPPIPADPLR